MVVIMLLRGYAALKRRMNIFAQTSTTDVYSSLQIKRYAGIAIGLNANNTRFDPADARETAEVCSLPGFFLSEIGEPCQETTGKDLLVGSDRHSLIVLGSPLHPHRDFCRPSVDIPMEEEYVL